MSQRPSRLGGVALLHPLRSEAVNGTYRTKIVYLAAGRLLLDPPGTLVYHRQTRSEWPRYIPDPDNPGFAKVDPERDRERHWTACGLLTYDSRTYRKTVLNGVRHDNADQIGRPCKRCFR